MKIEKLGPFYVIYLGLLFDQPILPKFRGLVDPSARTKNHAFLGLFEGGPGDEWGWIDLTENLVFEWSDGSSPSWLISQSTFQSKVTRCVQMWSNKLWNLEQHLDYLVSDCNVKSGGAICKKSAS